MATQEDMNIMTVRLVLNKPCTNLLQEVLRQHIPETKLHEFLKSQTGGLYPEFRGSYSEFDLSLLYRLFRDLMEIPEHSTGWGNEPAISDNSTAANIERIRLLRNKYWCYSTSHITDMEVYTDMLYIISCIHEIEKTLLVNSTRFEEAARKIFFEAKNQEDLEEKTTKRQGIICF